MKKNNKESQKTEKKKPSNNPQEGIKRESINPQPIAIGQIAISQQERYARTYKIPAENDISLFSWPPQHKGTTQTKSQIRKQ